MVVDTTPLMARDVSGFYGTLGTGTPIPNPNATAPGSRWGSSSWTDSAGNLWMLRGQGFDSTGGQDTALLNDIWEFLPGLPDAGGAGTFTGTWVWQGGSNIGNQSGVYGTLGAAAAANIPGGRWASGTATDPAGNVWLFGGQGYDAQARKAVKRPLGVQSRVKAMGMDGTASFECR